MVVLKLMKTGMEMVCARANGKISVEACGPLITEKFKTAAYLVVGMVLGFAVVVKNIGSINIGSRSPANAQASVSRPGAVIEDMSS